MSKSKKLCAKCSNEIVKPVPLIYKPIDGLPNAIICDLDGTLCIINGRSPYDASKCDNDELNNAVASIIKDRIVLFVSGRESKFIEQTIVFLKKHNIEYRALHMRKSGDMRKDTEIKKEIFENEIRPFYNIDFVLEDRNQVVDMWRSLGLTCLQVAEGNF